MRSTCPVISRAFGLGSLSFVAFVACGGAAAPSRAPESTPLPTQRRESEAPPAVSPPEREIGMGVALGGGGPEVVAGTPDVSREAAPPPDALAFVRRLMAARDPEQHDMIDWMRQSTIAGAVGVDDTTTSLPPPSVPDRRSGLPVGPPAGCIPAYTWGGGYEVLAMPPPMNGWPEPVIARVQQALDYLQAGHEVVGWCTYLIDHEVGSDDDGNPRTERRPTPGPAFVLNVFRGPEGWRVQAWSEMRGEEEGAYPQM